jgi:DNA-binding transcriptional ArsR family regulator
MRRIKLVPPDPKAPTSGLVLNVLAFGPATAEQIAQAIERDIPAVRRGLEMLAERGVVHLVPGTEQWARRERIPREPLNRTEPFRPCPEDHVRTPGRTGSCPVCGILVDGESLGGPGQIPSYWTLLEAIREAAGDALLTAPGALEWLCWQAANRRTP